jgi:beta-mannanase
MTKRMTSFIILLKANKYLIAFIIIVFAISTITAYRLSRIKYPPASECKDFGLYVGQNLDEKVFQTLSSKYEKKPSIILSFVGWSDYPFNHNFKELSLAIKYNYKPMITLEPWLFPSKKPIKLSEILDGSQNKVIIEFAKMLCALLELQSKNGNIIYIRFAHEMNGNWYPWSGAQNNNDPTLYKKAYIKVHKLISDYLNKQGINTKNRLKFVWSINANSVPQKSWNKAINYYPGDKYVDIIGLDAYNWGQKRGWFTKWKSFKNIFQKSIKELLPLNKPIYITETASAGLKKASKSTDKAKWIKELFKQINEEYSFIPVFIWFDIDKEQDWRIMSDENSYKAFVSGLKKTDLCKE